MKIIVTEEQIKEIINNVYDNYIIKDVSKPKKYGNVLSEEVIKPPNDENAYKREGYNFYYAKVGKNKQPDSKSKWIQITDEVKIRSVYKTIFKSNSGTYLKQGSTISSLNWVGCKNGFENGSVKIIGTKPFTKGFFKVGEQVYVTGYKLSAVGKSINGYVKILKVDPNLMGITIDKPWPPKVKGIQDECAKVQKVESNINTNAKTCGWGTYVDGYIQSGYLCPKPKKVAGKYPYGELLSWPTPQFIAKIIKESKGNFDDYEAWAEAAFMAIKTPDMYNKVKAALGQDPYKYVASFMDVNEKYHVQAIGVSYKFINSGVVGGGGQQVSVENFPEKCPLTLTVEKPGGNNTNNAPVDIFKYWGYKSRGVHLDPLLSPTMLGDPNVTIPSDFGWKFNNNIYPYPKLYSQSCVDTSGEWAKKEAKSNIFLKEYTDPGYTVQRSDSETTAVSKSYLGNEFNKNDFMSKEDVYNRNIGKAMINFNNSFIKQKELIPKYCKTPLEREYVPSAMSSIPDWDKLGKGGFISMYTLCKNFGGLWVHGVGTGEYTCGCRDMSNPTIVMSLQSDSGSINIGSKINDTQKSTNWSHSDSIEMVTNTIAFASAFIPVVGPFISAGISLGNAAMHWKQGKRKEAAVDALFALIPMLGKIPGVAKISNSIAKSLGSKLFNGGALSLEELNALKNVTQYDKAISTQILSKLKTTPGLQKHIVDTTIKKAEEELLGYVGLPTRKEIQKKIANATISTATTGLI
jgi:hypothetical protein